MPNLFLSVRRLYYRALVAVLLSRTWHVRKHAQQAVRKLLSSLGGFKLAYGLLEELKAVLRSHKVNDYEYIVPFIWYAELLLIKHLAVSVDNMV